jgi:hypothetical protein
MMNSTESLYIDGTRLPDGQAAWVLALVQRLSELLNSISSEERTVYTQVWKLMAMFGSPITTNHFADLKYPAERIRHVLTALNDAGLLWFDEDLRAVLRCAPFSVLHSPHHIKVFGWERAYSASFIEAPATLLVYGPNVWLHVQTTCPRSGETLKFRVMVRDDATLRYDAPPDAEHWVIWLPQPDNLLEGDVYDWLQASRLRIGAYHTQEDLDTQRFYEDGPPGTVYSLEQALYLSECLLYGYRRALDIK